jgi:hypothetical protein
MQKVGGYSSQTFIDQGVLAIPVSGGSTTLNNNLLANGAGARFVKHASQTGGTTPIAWLTFDGAAPTSANGYPIYDGDSLELYDVEVDLVKLASADATQPTVHWILWQLR